MRKLFVAVFSAFLFFSCKDFLDQAPVTVTLVNDERFCTISFASSDDEKKTEVSAVPGAVVDLTLSLAEGADGSPYVYYCSHVLDIDGNAQETREKNKRYVWSAVSVDKSTYELSFTVPAYNCDVFCVCD